MATTSRTFQRVSSAARQRADQYLHQTGDRAAQTVGEAESCVRSNPESAVWTAFGAGLLLGVIAGWVAAEHHEQSWLDEFSDYAASLRQRLRW